MLRPFFLLLALACASGAQSQAPGAQGQASGAQGQASSSADTRARGETFAERDARLSQEAVPTPAAYVVRERVALADAPDGRTVRTLRRRDGVRVLETSGEWSRVQWNETQGWVKSDALSDLWIRVDKSERTAYVYNGGTLSRTLPIDVSNTPEGDKTRQAGRLEKEEHRIPEGTFYVTRRNENSDYYLAFVLSYPSPVHALRGLEDGLISQGQYNAVVAAYRDFPRAAAEHAPGWADRDPRLWQRPPPGVDPRLRRDAQRAHGRALGDRRDRYAGRDRALALPPEASGESCVSGPRGSPRRLWTAAARSSYRVSSPRLWRQRPLFDRDGVAHAGADVQQVAARDRCVGHHGL